MAPALSRSVGSGTHPRLALSRMQMLEQLVLIQGIGTEKQSGLTCRALSECGCSGIHHPAEPVRKVAERVLLLVYKINPRLIRKQLPPDDDITRRNLLYRQLFTEFDKLDLQRRKDMLETNKTIHSNSESFSPTAVATSSSLYTQSPPSEHKQKTVKYDSQTRFGHNNGHHNKHDITASPVRRILKSKSGHTITISSQMDEPLSVGGDDSDAEVPNNFNGKIRYNEKLMSNENSRKSSNSDSFEDDVANNHCPFCDWSFYGDANQLDKHFWKACPILTKCPQCSQVLEVSAISAHLTSKLLNI